MHMYVVDGDCSKETAYQFVYVFAEYSSQMTTVDTMLDWSPAAHHCGDNPRTVLLMWLVMSCTVGGRRLSPMNLTTACRRTSTSKLSNVLSEYLFTRWCQPSSVLLQCSSVHIVAAHHAPPETSLAGSNSASM